MFYKGIYKELKEDSNIEIEEINFYEGYYASFYEYLLKYTTYDVDLYISQATLAGKKVLELACGTGRIGIPLAKAGFEVTGMDISTDMLEIYRNKLKKEPRRINNRIELIHGDITMMNLEEKFDLIILPATTICLFDDHQIQKIFSVVEQHLTEDGKFVFDRAIVDDNKFLGDSGLPFVTRWREEDTYNMVISQEFKIEALNEIVVNLYGERIEGNDTVRNIGYTRKRIITREIIEKNMAESNLKMERTIEHNNGEQNEIEFLVLSR